MVREINGATHEPLAAANYLVKTIMKKFTSLRLRKLAGNPGWLKLGLVILAGLLADVGRAVPAPANDNFASASPIIITTNLWGTTNGTTLGASPQTGEPSHAGNPASYSVWYKWTAPQDGVVQFDTLGTPSTNDTVLAVYTGGGLATLSQVAANDDLYPYPQRNYTAQNILHLGKLNQGLLAGGVLPPYTLINSNYFDTTNAPIAVEPVGGYYYQPYGGPSGLHFNAVGGTTYYIAVDSKSSFHYTGLAGGFIVPTGPGSFTLNWAYQPSGVFRFATENVDQTGITNADGSPMLLYQCSENETARTWNGVVGADELDTTIDTYYNYDAPGVLVTVTRVGGASGRVSVDYKTVNGNPGKLGNGDLAATNGVDYQGISGTLTFNDFEMSKTLLIPIIKDYNYPQPNRDFTLMLTNALLDLNEWSNVVPPPRVDTNYGQALVRILDVDTDPKGLSQYQLLYTNYNPGNGPLPPPPATPTNAIPMTNIVNTLNTTNPIFNFMKANFRVTRDVTNWYKGTPITVYVCRTGTNNASATVYWTVGNYFLNNVETLQNIYDPLQPGSDYATPDPTNYAEVDGLLPDFNFNASASGGTYSGSLNFPGGNNWDPQPIQFTVYDNGLCQFDEDLHIEIYQLDQYGNPSQPGMVSETTVTILADDRHPPAGSVDEYYNPDYSQDMAPPFGVQVAHPGTDQYGEVYGLAVLTNNETLIVGDFVSYNDSNGNAIKRNGIALVNTYGTLDTSFDPGSGVAGGFNLTGPFIQTVVLTTNNQYIIGGDFVSYNGTGRNGIAMVNTNGALNTSFLNGLTGVDGTVWAVAVQPDGKILIGGEFGQINGTPCNYIARLKTNGVVDASFNLSAIFTGPVHALALQTNGQIVVGGEFAVNGQPYSGIARLTTNGLLDTSFNPGSGADNMVRTVLVQPNGQIVMGGDFLSINGTPLNGIARLNTDGTIDSTGFFNGTGADGSVYNLVYATNVSYVTNITASLTNVVASTNNSIYVGGQFDSINGTRRVGFARLNTDGTVDTSFLDTAYNQFAGLVRIYSYDTPAVFAAGVQSDGKVMIGGSFNQVGGGQFSPLVGENTVPGNYDPNVWPERKTRDGIRNRNNLARLIGGSTPGPGNIGLLANYSAARSQGFLYATMIRTNGSLGPLSANFAMQPVLAQSGVDYIYNAVDPLYWIAWEYCGPTRMHSDGLFGTNGFVADIFGNHYAGAVPNLSQAIITVLTDPTVAGDLTANIQLANPSQADQFYLGGQDIPLGGALGPSYSPFTLIDDAKTPGTFGFSSVTFIATNASAAISVLRSNGVSGNGINIYYSTAGGTALANQDYTPVITPRQLSYGNGVVSNGFNIAIINNGNIYTNIVEKTVNLKLSGLNYAGATYGISNAVLRLINPNYKGFLTFSTNHFYGNVSAGFLSFVVNRTSGSSGAVSVQYATADGTAINGVNYYGATNILTWGSNDVSPRIVNIQLTNNLTVGPGSYFTVSLRNPTNNGAADPTLLSGTITTATNTINNDNSYGTLQFSAPSYVVNENGGYATFTVIRTGGDAGAVSVNFTNIPGPSPNGATNGVNYVATNGVLNFAAGQIAASFNVTILPDGRQDPTNGFYFNVRLFTNNATVGLPTLGLPTNALVYIVDTDSLVVTPGTPGTGTNSISGVTGDVLALALQPNGQIVVGGNYTAVANVPENNIARLNADGTLDDNFLNGLYGADGPVNALAVQSNSRILMGGAFTSVNGIYRNYVARLMTNGTLDTSFNPGPGADGVVNALAETFINGTREIYVGGAFTNINNVASPGIVRLYDNGSVDASFSAGSGADGAINAIAVYPTNSVYAGKVLIGGAFTHYNGTNMNYIARLNADGSVDTSFNAAASNAVSAIAIQLDGRILVGGSFIQFNGTALNRIARLNTDGSLDTNFVTNVGLGANNTVKSIAVQADNRIVLVGLFSQFNNLTCNRIVRLLPTGALDSTIDFGDGANSDVDALVLQPWNGMIIIGGDFTQFNDHPFSHLVRLFGGSKAGLSRPSVILPAGSVLEYESFSPHNNLIDPGETVKLAFAFTNSAGYNATNLVATLLVTNGITSPSGPQTNHGVLVVGGPAVSLPFYFTATNGANGQTIAATFQLQSGTNNLGLAVFSYLLGALTNTFASPNAIIINDYSPALPPYLATPYPSTINVSGVGGSLIKATVTFSNLAHTWPSDIDALLESPSQESTLLMAYAGGGQAVNGVTLTFDDNASKCLTNNGLIVSGTYKPTAYTQPVFPTPAPFEWDYVTNLTSLDNGNPNGGWSLYVIDDTPINSGVISNGWALNLITGSLIAAQPLQFQSTVISNGTFQFSVTGPFYTTIVQASTNLAISTNWISLYTNKTSYTNISSSFTFTDPYATNFHNRFYRVIVGP